MLIDAIVFGKINKNKFAIKNATTIAPVYNQALAVS
jgi:hypothetical protein